jgi:hypothetical protein
MGFYYSCCDKNQTKFMKNSLLINKLTYFHKCELKSIVNRQHHKIQYNRCLSLSTVVVKLNDNRYFRSTYILYVFNGECIISYNFVWLWNTRLITHPGTL